MSTSSWMAGKVVERKTRGVTTARSYFNSAKSYSGSYQSLSERQSC